MSSGQSQASDGAPRPQRVRIQVGLSASQNTVDERPVPTAAETAAAAAAAAATALPYAATTTLFDLCDSKYMTKKVKRPRKSKKNSLLLGDDDEAVAGGGSGSAAAAAAAAGGAGRKTLSSVAAAAAAASSSQMLARRRQDEPRAPTGPQVEFVNGNIVLKESSLVLPDASAEEEFEEQEEGAHSTATYFSFLKRKHGSKWGFEETWLYYKALRQCGTEFSLMQSFFPGRTRKQLKQKYIKEEREHPELIRRTLDHSMPLELDPFRAQFGQLRTGGAGAGAGAGGVKAGVGAGVAAGAGAGAGAGKGGAKVPKITKAAARAAARAEEVFEPVPMPGAGADAATKKRKAEVLAPLPAAFNPAEDYDDDLVDI